MNELWTRVVEQTVCVLHVRLLLFSVMRLNGRCFLMSERWWCILGRGGVLWWGGWWVCFLAMVQCPMYLWSAVILSAGLCRLYFSQRQAMESWMGPFRYDVRVEERVLYAKKNKNTVIEGVDGAMVNVNELTKRLMSNFTHRGRRE